MPSSSSSLVLASNSWRVAERHSLLQQRAVKLHHVLHAHFFLQARTFLQGRPVASSDLGRVTCLFCCCDSCDPSIQLRHTWYKGAATQCLSKENSSKQAAAQGDVLNAAVTLLAKERAPANEVLFTTARVNYCVWCHQSTNVLSTDGTNNSFFSHLQFVLITAEGQEGLNLPQSTSSRNWAGSPRATSHGCLSWGLHEDAGEMR